MTPAEAGMRLLNKRKAYDSVTVTIDGKKFSVSYQWSAADDSVGQDAHADIDNIYVGDDIEPMQDWMISRECHQRITQAVNSAHHEKLDYLARCEYQERLES